MRVYESLEGATMSTGFFPRRRGRSADLPNSLNELPARGAAPACGWYESSLELMQGLAVTEHAGLDELFPPEAPDPAASARPAATGG
ncbi:hypothetical protein CKO37_08275 [Rubrivivax gelatinosus]|nr:hypothetical protein [Rubrivivax gelatinosus]